LPALRRAGAGLLFFLVSRQTTALAREFREQPTAQLARPYTQGSGVTGLLASLPDILAG